MFSLSPFPETARALAAGAGKTAIRAIRDWSKEAPKHVSAAQDYAVSTARRIGAQAPQHLETARSYIGKAAVSVITNAPKHVHAVQHYAGDAAQVVVKKAPGHVGAVGGLAKTVVAETPRRFEQVRAFAAGAAKTVVTEGPRRLGTAGGKVVGVVGAARNVDARQYGRALAGGASTVGRRMSHIAKESSVAAAAMGAGLVAVAVPSTVTTPFLTAAGMLGPRAGETSPGSGADEVELQPCTEESSTAGSGSRPVDHRAAGAGGFGLAIINGVAQIVGGTAAVAGGLFGLLGHVFAGKASRSEGRPSDGDEERAKQKLG